MYVAYGSEARIRQIGKLPFGAFYAERQVCVELLTNALCSTNVGKGRLRDKETIWLCTLLGLFCGEHTNHLKRRDRLAPVSSTILQAASHTDLMGR